MNPIQDRGTYKKQDDLKKEMRKILSESSEGIGSEKFVSSVQEATGVSRGMIFAMIKQFASLGLMRIERGPPDRRKAHYFPNLEKVKTEQKLSEGMEFIQALLSEPKTEFAESETKSSGIHVSVGIFTNLGEKQNLEDQVRSIAKQFSSSYDKLLSKNMKVRPSTKLAFIITMES